MCIRHLATPRHRQEVRSDEFTYSLPWEEPFVYRIAWDAGISRRTFSDPDAFNNLIRFVGDAGDHLVRPSGLLRPLIHREWSDLVARFNCLPNVGG